MRIRVIEVTQRLEGAVDSGTDEPDPLTRRTEQLEAVIMAAPESAGQGVVVDKGRGESRGDDVEGIGGGRRGFGNVGADVTEGNAKVGIVVEVGEGEDVVVVEWRCRGSD